MGKFTKKGFKSLHAVDPKTGQKHVIAVDVDGRVAGIADHRYKKYLKEARKQRQEYKKNLREQKKNVPLAERSKINWREQGVL